MNRKLTRIKAWRLTLLALAVFGYIKGFFIAIKPFRSAWQRVLVGGLAETAAFVIAKAMG